MMFLRESEVEELFPGLLNAVLKGAASERPNRDDMAPPPGFHDDDESCAVPRVPKNSAKGPQAQVKTLTALDGSETVLPIGVGACPITSMLRIIDDNARARCAYFISTPPCVFTYRQ